MDGEKGGVMYTCLVDGSPKFGGHSEGKCLEEERVDIGYDVTIDYPDSESCGLDAVVCARLEDDGSSGFAGLGRGLMKEGVDRVLSHAVRRVCVDEAVFYVMMMLLYIESPRKCVCRKLVCGGRWKGKRRSRERAVENLSLDSLTSRSRNVRRENDVVDRMQRRGGKDIGVREV